MANSELLNGTVAPWWAQHRDKLFAVAFALLLLSALGLIPTPITKGIDSMMSDHANIGKTLQVMCVHQAHSDNERRECLQ